MSDKFAFESPYVRDKNRRPLGISIGRNSFDTNGPQSNVSSSRTYPVERDTPISLFNDQDVLKMAADMNLKGVTLFMFMYLIYNLVKDKGYSNMNEVDFCSFAKCSRRSYYDAVKSLKDSDVITKRDKKSYWFNPEIAFKGNRIDFYFMHGLYEEKLVVKSKGAKKSFSANFPLYHKEKKFEKRDDVPEVKPVDVQSAAAGEKKGG